jgi:RNA-splicing ligase RtcB
MELVYAVAHNIARCETNVDDGADIWNDLPRWPSGDELNRRQAQRPERSHRPGDSGERRVGPRPFARGLTEEISETHEKVRQAVDGLERTGVFWIVARLRPVGVTKARQHRR